MSFPNHTVLFCDDIREEKDDKTTYVGTMSNECLIPAGEQSIAFTKIIVAVFLTWDVSKPPVGWTLNIEGPHGKGIPFDLPPQGAEKIPPDSYTGMVRIIVHAHISPVIFKPLDKILVSLRKGRKSVSIGALAAVETLPSGQAVSA